MGVIDESLWAAIAAMRIEPEGATLTFTRRLARENGWSRAYAAKVVEEYRRFLYLAATDTNSVTPSEQVDQAWHLHLAYTRHYWEELCARIIGRPLHHGPTAGGVAEGRRYRSIYASTLQRYRDTFGAEPPSDIWPPHDVRFAVRYQWVDRSRYFVLPRRSVSIAGIAGGAVLLAACTALAADSAGAASPPMVRQFADMLFGTDAGLIGFVIVGTLALFIIAMLIDRVRGRGGRRSRQADGKTQRNRKLRASRDSSGGLDVASDGWSGSATGTAAAAGGAAFMGAGGEFSGSGADGDWDSGAGSDGADSGCSGCGGD
ncbi:hypothetical protein [Blastomonas sp.]|uniref:glycine-rich domain-containing protein n=1 Tax=Blastomonas sp. TaxID=1909299 RepID=UPI00261BB3B1|nr:hypothetical protein [Blastomonas sp.]MDM7955432.1 hypothetical protein [Blastomonas sp.]